MSECTACPSVTAAKHASHSSSATPTDSSPQRTHTAPSPGSAVVPGGKSPSLARRPWLGAPSGSCGLPSRQPLSFSAELSVTPLPPAARRVFSARSWLTPCQPAWNAGDAPPHRPRAGYPLPQISFSPSHRLLPSCLLDSTVQDQGARGFGGVQNPGYRARVSECSGAPISVRKCRQHMSNRR